MAQLPHLRELSFEGLHVRMASVHVLAETLSSLVLRLTGEIYNIMWSEWKALGRLKKLQRLELHNLNARGTYGLLGEQGCGLPCLEKLLLSSGQPWDDRRLADLVASCSSSLRHLTLVARHPKQTALTHTLAAANACLRLESLQIQTHETNMGRSPKTMGRCIQDHLPS